MEHAQLIKFLKEKRKPAWAKYGSISICVSKYNNNKIVPLSIPIYCIGLNLISKQIVWYISYLKILTEDRVPPHSTGVPSGQGGCA